MKALLPLLAILFLLGSCGNVEDETSDEIDSTQLLTIEYSVSGMTCGGCEKAIGASVVELPGVAEVVSSHEDAYTKVVFDQTKTDEESIVKAIEAKGYKVEGPYAGETEQEDEIVENTDTIVEEI